MLEPIWNKAAKTILKVTALPIPLSDTLISLLKVLLRVDQAEFISIFDKPNMNLDEIKQRTDLDEENIKRILDDLLNAGVLSGTRSRSTGEMIYRLMALFPGIFEFTFMRGGTGKKKRSWRFYMIFYSIK
jgi:hypothetical protein